MQDGEACVLEKFIMLLAQIKCFTIIDTLQSKCFLLEYNMSGLVSW